MHLQTILEQIGLTEKEANVYLALLEIGSQPIGVISKRTNINRTTCYKVVEDLIEKGLITSYKKHSGTYITAEEPISIIKYLQTQENKINRTKKFFIENLDYLKKVQNKLIKKPSVKFYEGKEALKQAYENTLFSNEPIRAYANIEEMHKALPDFFPDYYQRRTENGIFIYTICPDNQVCRDRKENDKEEMREIRFMSENKYNFAPEMNVYEDKVLFASWREQMAIVITSEEIANLHKSTFDALWHSLDHTT